MVFPGCRGPMSVTTGLVATAVRNAFVKRRRSMLAILPKAESVCQFNDHITELTRRDTPCFEAARLLGAPRHGCRKPVLRGPLQLMLRGLECCSSGTNSRV